MYKKRKSSEEDSRQGNNKKRRFPLLEEMKDIEPLKRGDTVALAATARKVSPEEMAPAIEQLRAWGLNMLIPEGLYAEENQFAGSDDHRAALLQGLLDDPKVKAILCCRGGYGTVRIVDRLDFRRFTEHPKWVVGYSDVTVLHSHLHTLRFPSISAPWKARPQRACGECCSGRRSTSAGCRKQLQRQTGRAWPKE